MPVRLIIFLRRNLIVAFVVAGGLSFSVLLYQVVKDWEREQLHHLIENSAEAQTNAIEARIQTIADELRTLRGNIDLRPNTSQNEFARLVESILEQHPMLHHLSWAPRVVDKGRVRFPVVLNRSSQIAPPLPEYDITVEQQRLRALLQAIDSATLTATRPVVLQPGDIRGVLVMLPVFRPGAGLRTLEERYDNLTGILIAGIDTETLFEDTVGRLFWDHLDFVVREAGAQGELLHVHAPRSPSEPTPTAAEIQNQSVTEQTMVRAANQSWALVFAASPDFHAQHASARPTLALLLGLLLTAAAMANALLLQRRQQRVKELVAQQTAALRDSEARLLDLSSELRLHRDHLQEMVLAQTVDLVEAKNAAERASKAKSEFLANMSHELRTPIHAILSFARIGHAKAERAPAEKVREYMAHIRASGERLLELVNDLLDLSKLEAGRMQYVMGQVDLRHCVADVSAELAPLFETRKQAFRLDVCVADCHVHGDRKRLDQVLRNLLGNAIKFTPEARQIRVGIDAAHLPAGFRAADAGAVPALCLRVEDEGMGIPDGEFETIFDKFAQGSSTNCGAGGTGLGLAICREIVHAHHGSIRAYNRAGGGAIFEVLLPATRRDET